MTDWKRSLIHLKLSKALSLISLATKAGKTASGEFCTEKEIKTGYAELVIVAEDAPEHTKERFQRLADRFQAEFMLYGEKNRLGQSIGKSPRNVVLISDKNFAKQIVNK
jgi:ribosomal protein L7Ae-like RNA K-turn-binding protein